MTRLANISKDERLRFEMNDHVATATLQRKVGANWPDVPGGPHYRHEFDPAGFQQKHFDAWATKMAKEPEYRKQFLIARPAAPAAAPAPAAAGQPAAAAGSLAAAAQPAAAASSQGPADVALGEDDARLWAGWPGPLPAGPASRPASQQQPVAASQQQAGQPGEAESVTIKAVDRRGYDVLFCLRGYGDDLVDRVLARLDWLAESGFRPTFTPQAAEALPLPVAPTPELPNPNPTGGPVSLTPAPLPGPIVQQPGAPLPLATGIAAPVPVTSTTALAFAAETLICALDEKGVPLFKVRGGTGFRQYGVRIWPEVLQAAGIEPTTLVLGQTYILAGWIAHWTQGVGGKGQKVTRLERAS